MLTVGEIDNESKKVKHLKNIFEQTIDTLKLEGTLDNEAERELRIEFQEQISEFKQTRLGTIYSGYSIEALEDETDKIKDFVANLTEINAFE